MSDPLPPGAEDTDPDDEDAYAQLLLADALGGGPVLPGMGEPNHSPDMGDNTMTAPVTTTNTTNSPAGQPAAQQPGTGNASSGSGQQPGTGSGQQTGNSQHGQDANGGQQAPQGANGKTYATGVNGEDLGYPVNTPVAEMTAKEEAAYWRHKARVHEDKWKGVQDYDALKDKAGQYDALVATQQTEQELAVKAARVEGETAGRLAAGAQVVDMCVKAAAAGRMPEQGVNALLEGLDRSRFIDAKTGAVDTDRVYQWIGSIAPVPAAAAGQQDVPGTGAAAGAQAAASAPAGVGGVMAREGITSMAGVPGVGSPGGLRRAPDFGQGTPASARPSGLAAGRELARQRFGKNNAQTSA